MSQDIFLVKYGVDLNNLDFSFGTVTPEIVYIRSKGDYNLGFSYERPFYLSSFKFIPSSKFLLNMNRLRFIYALIKNRIILYRLSEPYKYYKSDENSTASISVPASEGVLDTGVSLSQDVSDNFITGIYAELSYKTYKYPFRISTKISYNYKDDMERIPIEGLYFGITFGFLP